MPFNILTSNNVTNKLLVNHKKVQNTTETNLNSESKIFLQTQRERQGNVLHMRIEAKKKKNLKISPMKKLFLLLIPRFNIMSCFFLWTVK